MGTLTKGFFSAVKLTDRSVVATCLLGNSNPGSGLFGFAADGSVAPASPVASVDRGRDGRPTQAPEAAAVAQAKTYALAAAGAGSRKQMHDGITWASRGLKPWSYPALCSGRRLLGRAIPPGIRGPSVFPSKGRTE
jgi:hypothetical protein